MKQAWLIIMLLALSGFTVSNQQIAGERKAQETLPKSGDPTWKLLRTTKLKLDEKNWIYTAKIPAEVKKLSGKPLTVQGFMLPLESAEGQAHFILSRLTPVCPFCPPGEPNEIIEVFSKKPIPFSYDLIKITGTFSLTDNGEKGIFYQMKDATVVQ